MPICSIRPRAHADDAVGHRRRLDLVVGDEDRGDAELALQAPDLGAHGEAQRGVEVGQRLVEQQELRLLDQRAGERDALLLAARQLGRPAVEQFARPEPARAILARPALRLRRAARCLKRSGNRMFVARRHVRIERVGLEDDADVAVARLDLVDHRAVEADLAGARRVDAGEHEQRRRLAAARRPEDRDELAVLDREVGRLDGDRDRPSACVTPVEFDRAIAQPLIPPIVIWVRYFWREGVEEQARQRRRRRPSPRPCRSRCP